MTKVIKLDITDTIEQAEWTPMTSEEIADYERRMDWQARKVRRSSPPVLQFCQICIITDTIAAATHTCEACGFEICDNEANHILDHGRIDSEAN